VAQWNREEQRPAGLRQHRRRQYSGFLVSLVQAQGLVDVGQRLGVITGRFSNNEREKVRQAGNLPGSLLGQTR
jgi:hypothetical protein